MNYNFTFLIENSPFDCLILRHFYKFNKERILLAQNLAKNAAKIYKKKCDYHVSASNPFISDQISCHEKLK